MWQVYHNARSEDCNINVTLMPWRCQLEWYSLHPMLFQCNFNVACQQSSIAQDISYSDKRHKHSFLQQPIGAAGRLTVLRNKKRKFRSSVWHLLIWRNNNLIVTMRYNNVSETHVEWGLLTDTEIRTIYGHGHTEYWRTRTYGLLTDTDIRTIDGHGHTDYWRTRTYGLLTDTDISADRRHKASSKTRALRYTWGHAVAQLVEALRY
jgi:hypothetical protein